MWLAFMMYIYEKYRPCKKAKNRSSRINFECIRPRHFSFPFFADFFLLNFHGGIRMEFQKLMPKHEFEKRKKYGRAVRRRRSYRSCAHQNIEK